MLTFDPLHPDFDAALSVDFGNCLPSGATLSSGTVTCDIDPDSEVADASASSRVYGSATVSGSILTRKFKDGVKGADYVFTFVPVFSNGDIDPLEVGGFVRKEVA